MKKTVMIKTVEERLPEFVEAVKLCVSGETDLIILTIGAFSLKESNLFYLAMWYAAEKKVIVELAPRSLLQERLRATK